MSKPMKSHNFKPYGEQPAWKKQPYLDDIPELAENRLLKVDEQTYMHRKNKPSNMQKSIYEKYVSRKQSLEALTAKEVMTALGAKNIFEPILVSQLKLPWPKDYPVQPKPHQKMVHSTRISDAYRFGGHVNKNSLVYYIFWVDISKCDIYDHN